MGAISQPQPQPQPQRTLCQLRQDRGWTQEELAQYLGVNPSAVSSWECGVRVPSEMYRQRLAWVFGISVAEIACRAAEEQS